jgi:serine/threonine protein kinase
MALSQQRWKRVTESAFPWEAEALEYIRSALPDCDPYCGWTNFSFVADDGAVNEVDALVATPRGLFLVEIKSDEGALHGDRGTWIYHKANGRRKTVDNPLLNAERKCKKLKSLLERQPACKTEGLPFIESLIFLSNPDLSNQLPEADRIRVCQRDRDNAPGIIGALKSRTALGQKQDVPLVNRPAAHRLARALDEAGIRPSMRHRRVGDYELKELLAEGPDSAFQDWRAEHVSLKNDTRRIRIYLVSRQPAVDPRVVHKMAESEYDILKSLRHPGILEAQTYTEHELGPAVLFRYEPGEIRLDHYLKQQGATLPVHLRIDFVRQIADALRYAHGRRVIHRALSPQSILVTGADTAQPQLKIFNWQAGRIVGATSQANQRTSVSLHVEDWLEDASYVYIAPEAIGNRNIRDEGCDIFSLGALAFHIFSNRPPAPNLRELHETLAQHHCLPLPAVLDGASSKLEKLVRQATQTDTLLRTDSAAAFLRQLDAVEDELTAPEDGAVPDPLNATIDDRLPGSLVVKGKLGAGGSAAALLVERGNDQFVLKVALKPEYNSRLRDELEVLQKLRHQFIVAPKSDLLNFNGLNAFLVDLAGERTLAARLREDGRLSGEFLERFGDDLLNVLEYLEHEGVPHRDLKPDNIGVREYSKQLHLKLFDFSLSRLPLDNTRAGTPDYMEPFLALRPRWDPHAERFSAALVLYEMAAGTLPRWGNGQSAPHLIEDEVTIASNLFDSQVRETLTRFFSKALRRKPEERFDTAAEMRKAWHAGFSEARFTESHAPDPSARTLAINNATPETPVLSLNLSTRAQNVLERENINTVANLVATQPSRFRRLRGVGDKTRKEIIDLIAELRLRFPESVIPPKPAPSEDETPPAHSVDEIASQLLPAETSKSRADRGHLTALLDLDGLTDDRPPAWPNQSEVAEARHVTRARIGQIVTSARQRWRRNSSLTEIRGLIAERLKLSSGLLESGELASIVLAARGSTSEGLVRIRLASAVARAAVEAEHAIDGPRFVESRCLDAVLIVSTDAPEAVDWARRVGEAARLLANAHPLPAPARALETLRAIPAPGNLPPVEDARLLRFAAALAGAALSPRLELYPKGMPARDALELSRSAPASADSISVQDLRIRVRDRYPEAEPLPDRPALDGLLDDAAYDWAWDPEACVYRPRRLATEASTPYAPRSATRLVPRTHDVPPAERDDFETARDTEHKLSVAARHGSPLILSASMGHYYEAIDEIVRRFHPEIVDLDRALLDAMREIARTRNIPWDRVLTADAEPEESRYRTRLGGLVADAVPQVEAALRARPRPVLLVNPGLLARYSQLSLIDRLRENPGPGVWLLVAGQDTHKPMIDSEAAPLISPNQWARVNMYWIQNRHRAGATA